MMIRFFRVSEFLALALGFLISSLTVLAATKTWTGTSGDGLWATAGNWDPSVVPAAGDAVVFADVTSARTVRLTASTPALASLTIGAKTTLMTSNWFTKISATTVTVKSGGVLTCGAAFTSAQMSNRVWVACTDMTVESGGSVILTGKGYAAWNGPGAAGSYIGASHGGYGSKYFGQAVKARLPYGDAETPTTPGSGSGQSGAGGGALLVEATGTVTVDGTIEASASEGTKTSNYTVGFASGGSICIKSNRFKANGGTLWANGEYSESNWWSSWDGGNNTGWPGGGGRVSVTWDSDAEQDSDVTSVRVSARGGYMRFKCNVGTEAALYNFYQRSPTVDDAYHCEADLGTLWFTDDKLIRKALASDMAGNVVHPAKVDLEATTMTAGHVRFSCEGADVTVNGNLVVTGACTRLEVGGRWAENRLNIADPFSNTPWKFTVRGDMTVAGGARFDARAAATNGTDVAGGVVTVAGALKLEGHKAAREHDSSWQMNYDVWSANSSVYAHSDKLNGGSALFEVGSLLVESNALFTAARMGFASGNNSRQTGYGPGGGIGNSATTMMTGGGHGGMGGNATYGGGTTNDYAGKFGVLRPSLAGSGGSGKAASWECANGGGIIRVRAVGSVRVDGTVSANGENAPDAYVGGGAGGTILIDCSDFAGNANGLLTACGGTSPAASGSYSAGAGGGGRIAVWTGYPFYEKMPLSKCTVTTNSASFAGNITAAGGVSAIGGAYNGGDGTACFVHAVNRSVRLIFQ